jgi:hypothetical protein
MYCEFTYDVKLFSSITRTNERFKSPNIAIFVPRNPKHRHFCASGQLSGLVTGYPRNRKMTFFYYIPTVTCERRKVTIADTDTKWHHIVVGADISKFKHKDKDTRA